MFTWYEPSYIIWLHCISFGDIFPERKFQAASVTSINHGFQIISIIIIINEIFETVGFAVIVRSGNLQNRYIRLRYWCSLKSEIITDNRKNYKSPQTINFSWSIRQRNFKSTPYSPVLAMKICFRNDAFKPEYYGYRITDWPLLFIKLFSIASDLPRLIS